MHPYVERDHRVSVRCACTIVEDDGYEIEGELINVSRRGVGLQASAELISGDTVELRMHRSAAHRVRLTWACGQHAGGVFLDNAALMR